MRIFIIPNLEKAHTTELTNRAAHQLLRLGAQILMEEKFRPLFPVAGVRYGDFDGSLRACDIRVPSLDWTETSRRVHELFTR